ncbi:serine/threonine protein kinase [Ancylobacter sp. 6x-1]|uniref:Serine/threonine protein kinase n=1 Tax=Ancylobacter crimeensis TaxID=2579147 RepID=A0ABT0D7M7_9HYPH|nr:serine/threonine-protein kinase [Ancylobacter crimeensis]MCK0195939.1 serine/threonine protein kinase [Ancylobacter crimeensis]
MASHPPSGSSGTWLPPGTRLNDLYEIEEGIAAGGMGEIYRGRAIHTGEAVAIKTIRSDIAETDIALAMFRREAAALSTLYHEAIVRYYVFSVDPVLQRPYLAMEYVSGPSLSAMIKDGPLDYESVRVFGMRVADGLHAAHRRGIFHRDISPDNFIVPEADVAQTKIIDFGIARQTQASHGTVVGDGFAGKYNYVSPEQLGMAGGDVTAASDIYSLGLVFAEAVAGCAINMRGNPVEQIEKRRVVPDLSHIDPRLQPLLEMMLQPDPRDRPGSMTEVAAWLRRGGTRAPVHGSFEDDHEPTVISSAALPRERSAGEPSFAPGRETGTGRRMATGTDAGRPTTGRAPTDRPMQGGFSARETSASMPVSGRATFSAQRDAAQDGAFEEQSRGRGRLLALPLAAAALLLLLAGGGAYWMLAGGKVVQTASTDTADTTRPSATPSATPSIAGIPKQPASNPAKPPPMGSAAPPRPGSDAMAAVKDVPAAALGRYLADYGAGPCVFISPLVIADNRATAEGYGRAQTDFDQLDSDFRAANGFDPDILLRQVDPAQCPMVELLQKTRTDGAARPRLELASHEVKPGDMLLGEAATVASSYVAVVFILRDGTTRVVMGATRQAGDPLAFAVPLEAKAAVDSPVIVAAIAAPRPLDVLKQDLALPAGAFAERLLGQASDAGVRLATTARYAQIAP